MAEYWDGGEDNGAGGTSFFTGAMGAIPGINILSGAVGNLMAHEAEDRMRKAQIGNLNKIADPRYSTSDYKQSEYSGDFAPEMYGTPEEAQYKTISEDPRVRGMQMAALQRLMSSADQAADGADALGRYNAINDAGALAAQRENAIRQQMAMRGQSGGASEFLLQQQAAQDAANRAQAASLNSAQQAALMRLQGGQAAMSGASNMRGMDADIAGRNADIINKFNMYNTNARNATMAGNTEMRNSANLRNLDARQNNTNMNTQIRNNSIDKTDRNETNRFNAQMDKVGAINNAMEGRAMQNQRALRDGQEQGERGKRNLNDLMMGMIGGAGGAAGGANGMLGGLIGGK